MAGNLTTPNFSQPGWYAKYTSKQVTLALAFGLLGGGAYYVYKESLADSYNQAFKDAKKVGCCVFFFVLVLLHFWCSSSMSSLVFPVFCFVLLLMVLCACTCVCIARSGLVLGF
jgi:hypothetical protein